MSKKVIRLTESELRKLIDNVISEQMAAQPKPAAQAPKPASSVKDDPDYNKAWGVMYTLIDAIEGVGTDEPKVLKAVQSIGTKRVYQYLLQIVQKSPTVKSKTKANYKTVMEYIMTDFQVPGVDKPEHQTFSRPNDEDAFMSGYKNDGYSKRTSTQIPKQCANILGQFNEAEYDAFSGGLSRTYDYV